MIYYITSNDEKIVVARKYLSPFGIEIEQKTHNFIEIQSESIEKIAQHKAEQAFKYFNHPLLINDAGWFITALNGFPGAYMKYINEWFSAENILQLMQAHNNREIIYKEIFCYIDSSGTKLFTGSAKGEVLMSPQGTGLPSWQVFSLSNNGKSIAQCWEEGIDPVNRYGVWEEIANYLKREKPLKS